MWPPPGALEPHELVTTWNSVGRVPRHPLVIGFMKHRHHSHAFAHFGILSCTWVSHMTNIRSKCLSGYLIIYFGDARVRYQLKLGRAGPQAPPGNWIHEILPTFASHWAVDVSVSMVSVIMIIMIILMSIGCVTVQQLVAWPHHQGIWSLMSSLWIRAGPAQSSQLALVTHRGSARDVGKFLLGYFSTFIITMIMYVYLIMKWGKDMNNN